MKYNPEKHHRRSIRLKGYDYSQEGAYFVTICTNDHQCIFGNILNGKMKLNDFGEIVESEWLNTAQIRTNVDLDEYIIMPNHLHGIIFIVDKCRGTTHRAPTAPPHESFGKPVSGSIPTIIRGFKSTVTKQINLLRNTPGLPVWQRNYFEHVIRDEKSLHQIRQYIMNNPLQWELDNENPNNVKAPKK